MIFQTVIDKDGQSWANCRECDALERVDHGTEYHVCRPCIDEYDREEAEHERQMLWEFEGRGL